MHALIALLFSTLLMSTSSAEPLRPAKLAPLGPPPIPADNPQTPEKVDLGRLLFFDARLSGDASMSCASCHLPKMGWAFKDSVSLGYPGTVHWRNSQTIVNAAYYGELFWDGAAASLEKQAPAAAKGAVAGNGEADQMEARLAFIPEYRKRFKQVFGETWPTLENAWRAIAAFERTLVQTDTPFDRYMRGDDHALNAQQKRGLALFVGQAGCSDCHNGALLSDQKYHNIGVPPAEIWAEDGLAQVTFRFELYSKGVDQTSYRHFKDDPGLYFRSKHPKHKGLFRTPSLRYLQYTAPYMHNGTFWTLEEVVAFYNDGGDENMWPETKSRRMQSLDLTTSQQKDLVAFLLSLSGEQILMPEPELPPMQPLTPQREVTP
ncbi:cytochrome-c peroxidase [Magnetococcus sp. PR-3]|uniref:cytochrome-c peroxidase n=1 Tax=Magnetococcus sp. PR-3 TaxID=3120355 RepID=UPI002FCE303B